MKILKPLIFILALLILLNSSLAYYADINIFVDEHGLTKITGETNSNITTDQNPDYTSKKGRYWTFNLTTDEIYSDAIFTLHLPKNSKINYLKTPHLSRIEDTDKGIRIIGTAKDQPLTIIVQYQIENYENSYLLYYLIPSIIIITGIAIYFFIRYKKAKPKIDIDAFTERQQTILKLLIKNKGKITQSKLEKVTKMPKSSLSRNIDSLARKEIITKKQKGMSNMIILNK